MTELDISLSPPRGRQRPMLPRSTSFKNPTSAARPKLVRTASARSANRSWHTPKLERSSSFRCSPKAAPRSPSKTAASPQRSVSSPSPRSVMEEDEEAQLEFPDSKRWAKVQLSDNPDDEEEEDSEDGDDSTRDLLVSGAKGGRKEQQKLMDELKKARKTIAQKDAEIKQLTGRLHSAISTKRDLAQANQDLEIQHEVDMHELSMRDSDLRQASFHKQEVRAEVEMEFMNELAELSAKVENVEKRRIYELKRKDDIIGLLREKLSRMDELIRLAQRVEESEDRLLRACDEKDQTIQRLQEQVDRLERERQMTAGPDIDKAQLYNKMKGGNLGLAFK